jgi:endonuclease G
LILTLTSFSLFAFTSKYLPNYNIDIHCDKVLHKHAFDICYSCKLKNPLAVVYKVDANLMDKYNLSRKHLSFKPDYSLPRECRSYPKDYSHTGLDRGHNAPNSIFDYNKTIQKETFLMSNIAPQKPKLNRHLWAKIERVVRYLARKHKKEGPVRVITGSCGSLGNLGKKRHYVNVPKWWYKIIFLPNGKTLSFLALNSNRVGYDRIKKHIVHLKTIERVCGFKIEKKGWF